MYWTSVPVVGPHIKVCSIGALAWSRTHAALRPQAELHLKPRKVNGQLQRTVSEFRRYRSRCFGRVGENSGALVSLPHVVLVSPSEIMHVLFILPRC